MQAETQTQPKETAQEAPYYFYTVATTISRYKYKPKTFHSIVRSNRYADIKPAMEKAYAKLLVDGVTRIANVDARKLKADFLIYDVDQFVNQAEEVKDEK